MGLRVQKQAPRLPKSWRRLDASQRQARLAKHRMRTAVAQHLPLDPADSARAAGLRYVNDQTMAGLRRVGGRTRVRYVDANGRTITDRTEIARIRSLAIPPAWTDVWICPVASGHVQATGRDARGRKQYRYHPRWREVRDQVKYGRLIAFAQALPRVRARTAADLQQSGLSRERVLAAVVQLLEKTLIRVGNEEYARQNHSFGLTTMRDQHADVNGSTVRFEFRGKSGIEHAVDLRDSRLARIVKACRDLPGYELFQYVGEDGSRQGIDSADVNAYLREITGEDFTAKDFRTWAGTVLAASALAELDAVSSRAQARRHIVRVVETVAKRLGNTKAVCRKCYIHPAILDGYFDGATVATIHARAARLVRNRSGLTDTEAAVVAMIEQHLRKRSREARSQSAA